MGRIEHDGNRIASEHAIREHISRDDCRPGRSWLAENYRMRR